jgi:hypothetical protein
LLSVLRKKASIHQQTFREEHRPGVFENRVLRKIFGPKRDEATGDWIRPHHDEVYDIYS